MKWLYRVMCNDRVMEMMKACSTMAVEPSDRTRSRPPMAVGKALHVERERITAMTVAAALYPIVLPKYGGKTVFHLGGPMTFKAIREQTGGALGLIEYHAPVGAGTPPHIHHHEDEAFYVLAGQLTVWADGVEQKAGPGGFVFLPCDVPHCWRVEGPEAVRMLIILTPGGFEGLLDTYAALEAQLGEGEEVDVASMAPLLVRYGLEPVNS